MRSILPMLFLCCSVAGASTASAATLSKTYRYFFIGGVTLPEIEQQLYARGPRLDSTGQRHPGATRMEFRTRVSYAQDGRRCRIARVSVTVNATITLPKWRTRHRADEDVRLIWDTLARDIKRHEESHLNIAKNHARQLEETLKTLPWRRDCEVLAADAARTAERVLAEHDAAQARFDRIEAVNFESRMERLLRYRLDQIEAARSKR